MTKTLLQLCVAGLAGFCPFASPQTASSFSAVPPPAYEQTPGSNGREIILSGAAGSSSGDTFAYEQPPCPPPRPNGGEIIIRSRAADRPGQLPA